MYWNFLSDKYSFCGYLCLNNKSLRLIWFWFGVFCGPSKNQVLLDLESRQLKTFQVQELLMCCIIKVHFSWLEILAVSVESISTVQYNFPDNADGSSSNSHSLSKETVQWTEMNYMCFQHQTFIE